MPARGTTNDDLPWAGGSPPEIALSQVRELVEHVTSLHGKGSARSFDLSMGATDTTPGIRSARGALSADGVVTVRLELVRAPQGARAELEALRNSASDWAADGCPRPPESHPDGSRSYHVEIAVSPQPLSVARHERLLRRLGGLQRIARELQSSLPASVTDAELTRRFAPFADKIRAIQPGVLDGLSLPGSFARWVDETIEMLLCSYSVALASPSAVATKLAVTALAGAARAEGLFLGDLLLPAVPPLLLAQVVSEIPGVAVVPGRRVRAGTQRYEGDEIGAMVEMFTDAQTPVVFTGRYAQLQAVFHGGQGASAEPLLPAIRRVPALGEDLMARFAVREASARFGGVSRGVEQRLSDDLGRALGDVQPGQVERVLPGLAARACRAQHSGKTLTDEQLLSCVGRVLASHETFSGLAEHPRSDRDPEVAQRFRKVLTDEALLPYLRRHLLGQDRALEELCARLATEGLTRPLHLPIRYCAQGVPGTGKSASALLLARRLGVPFVNIDTASLPDFAMASTQLLGSGPGFVGSDRAGRLERAARHHRGAVIEISDLDHARPGVREPLGDLFLQVLQTGEAQAASGAMFSCANLIFVFTLNLPGGQDEKVAQRTGFGGPPSHRSVRRKVEREMRQLLSTAFIDRVGSPILFSPLSRESWGAIVERAVVSALELAASQMGWPECCFVVDGSVGEELVAHFGLARTGARPLLEKARKRAADAFIRLHRGDDPPPGYVVRVTTKPQGNLELQVDLPSSE